MPIKTLIALALLVIVAAVAQTGAYTVEQDEKAVVLTWGVYTDTKGPGLHFKLPWPVQTAQIEQVTHFRRIEIGFRTVDQGGAGKPAVYRDFKEDKDMLSEAQMFTGDENIVNVEIVVQYRISSLNDWLFNTDAPEQILRMISEAALRQVVGDHSIDDVLVQKRSEISNEIRNKIAEVAKQYGVGVDITSVQMQEALPPKEVSGAFKDVATAKEESAKLLNQAKGYENEKHHQAGGAASRIRNQASGYASERILLATGETNRFLALATEYQKNPDIMKERLYQESLQRALPKTKKFIVDGNTNTLNLNKIAPDKLIEGGAR